MNMAIKCFLPLFSLMAMVYVLSLIYQYDATAMPGGLKIHGKFKLVHFGKVRIVIK